MFFSSSFCDNFLDLSVTDPDESGSEILYLVVKKLFWVMFLLLLFLMHI